MATDSAPQTVPAHPLGSALRILLADIGASAVIGVFIGLVLGVALGLARATPAAAETTGVTLGLALIGFAVSVYAAMVLYRKYTSSPRALSALILLSIIYLALDFLAPDTDTVQTALFGLGQIASYFAGWFLGKTALLQGWLPGDRTLLVLGVIGGVIFLLDITSTLSQALY